MQIARCLVMSISLYSLLTLSCLAGDIDRQILIAIKPGDILLSPSSIKDSIQYVAISSPSLMIRLEDAGVKEIEYALPEHVTVSPQYKIPPAGRQHPNVDGYFFLTFNSQEDRDSALEVLKNNTDIYLASKRTPLECDAGVIPNDSLFWQQWGLKNVGQAGGSYDTDINAPEAWEITRGDPKVILSVVDGGVFTDHPDLMARTWLGNETFFDQHGCGVAGVMAASTNNGRGIAGVDWQCQIFAGYASTGEPGGIDETKAYYCIVGAVDEGASAINTIVLAGSKTSHYSGSPIAMP